MASHLPRAVYGTEIATRDNSNQMTIVYDWCYFEECNLVKGESVGDRTDGMGGHSVIRIEIAFGEAVGATREKLSLHTALKSGRGVRRPPTLGNI